MGLRLTRAADYAVRAMIHIGSLPEDGVALKDDIAHAQHISPSFTAKILRQLVKAGLLHSARGVNGGFGLARQAARINLLEVIGAIEGPLRLNDCAPDPDRCTLSHDCPVSAVWLDVQDQMTAVLRETTLAALLAASRRSRQAVYNTELRSS